MTTRQLTALGRRYMKRLGMVEWIPKATIRVISLKGFHGQSSWVPEERECWIGVSPNKDQRVMEETLIHEICHILHEGHKPATEEYDEAYELSLNRLAKTLWEAWNA